MTFDAKLPRWLAVILVALWAVYLVEGIVATAINARANLHYLESNGSSPPPPYPGQPAMQKPETPEEKKDVDKKKDDGGKRLLRPRR